MLLELLEAAGIFVPAHHQVRKVQSLRHLDHGLDRKVAVVRRGVDHLVLRVHDVLAVEGPGDDVGLLRRVGCDASVGPGLIHRGQHVHEGAAKLQLQVLDDVVAVALGTRVDLHIQVDLVVLVRDEQIAGEDHQAVFV